MIPKLKNPYHKELQERSDLTQAQREKLMLKASIYTEGWIDLEKAIEPKIKTLEQLLTTQEGILSELEYMLDGREFHLAQDAIEVMKKMIEIVKPLWSDEQKPPHHP